MSHVLDGLTHRKGTIFVAGSYGGKFALTHSHPIKAVINDTYLFRNKKTPPITRRLCVIHNDIEDLGEKVTHTGVTNWVWRHSARLPIPKKHHWITT